MQETQHSQQTATRTLTSFTLFKHFDIQDLNVKWLLYTVDRLLKRRQTV